MKKNIIFATAFCLSVIGCSKVGLNPDTPATPPTTTITSAAAISAKSADVALPIDPVSKCFTITNTEKAEGFVEYTFSYVDEHGEVQTASLGFGQSISFSSIDGKVKTNFEYFLIEGGGNCGPRRSTLPPGPCVYYMIQNPFGEGGMRIWYEYTDCDGYHTRGELNPLGTIYINAVPGTVNSNGVVITR